MIGDEILFALGLSGAIVVNLYKKQIWDKNYATMDHIPNFWLPWIIVAALFLFSVF